MPEQNTPRPFVSGDHCRFSNLNGEPIAIHYDCDDYRDGIKTSIATGKVVHA
jgi:hypothetical protein